MGVSQSVDPPNNAWTRFESRTWRRRLIVAMYVGWVALLAEVLVHERFGRPWPPGIATLAALIFALTSIVVISSWAWMLTAAVRYGYFHTRRRAGVTRLRKLKAQGYSAREALAVVTVPPDERQEAIRHRAQARAFQISGVVVGLGAMYAVLATQLLPGLWLPHTGAEIWAIVTALTLLYTTLPAAILAWTEPDPPSEVPVTRIVVT